MNKKQIKGKNASRKRADTSPAISKEIMGISLMGISILVLIGIFSDKSGLFGSILQKFFVGTFGIGGYIVPISAIFIGVLYIQGDISQVIRSCTYIGTLCLILMVLFHLLSFADYREESLLSLYYFTNGNWNNGGYLGAVMSYSLLGLIGIYGAYVTIIVLAGVWLLLLTKFPIFSWLNEKALDMSALLRLKVQEQSNMKQSRPKKDKLKQTKATTKIKVGEHQSESQDEDIQTDNNKYIDNNSTNEIVIYDSSSYSEDIPETPITNEYLKKDIRDNIKHEEKASTPAKIDKESAVEDTIEEINNSSSSDIIQPYEYPSIDLLQKAQIIPDKEAAKKSLSNARKLEETLMSFGVEAKVTQIHKGPSVTRYELQPKQGVKVSKIVNLADDIALNLAAPNIRIEAPIPGKAAVGIEVANETSEMVYLREVIDSDRFLAFPSKLAFALGKDIAGKPIIADIGKMPHILIAGATGSGKSVCINTLITSIIYKSTPEEVKLIMIDPKVVELSVYNGIPHLLIPVVTDPKKAAGALFWAVNEMTKRYNLFAENNVRDMKGYNDKQEIPSNKLPQIVIIIDELADLMMTGAKEVEDAICRLAQMARAAGIHLVIATQRPSVDVITGVIKANIPSRLAFAVSSGTDSRTILDMVGAEKLLGKGDMLFYPVGQPKPVRIQGAFISDKEVENIVNSIKTDKVVYEEEVIKTLENSVLPTEDMDDEEDELLEKAVQFAVGKEKLSISMLQRYFRIGFNRAARLMDSLEARGVVGPDEGSKPRKVL